MSADAIFGWAGRLSDYTQALHERRQVHEQIRNAESTCGSCSKWMTRGCPAEKHNDLSGRSVGPSSLTIKCAQFDMTTSATNCVQLGKARLAEINEKLAGMASNVGSAA